MDLIALSIDLLKAAMLWLGYVALDPIVRKRLPNGLISWTGLTSGRSRDPIVGRDTLAGLFAGVAAHIWWSIDAAVRVRAGGAGAISADVVDAISRFSSTLARIPNEAAGAMLQAFALFLIFFFSACLADATGLR